MNDPSEFCKAMDEWANACITGLPTDDVITSTWRAEFATHWMWIRRAISKSNLLLRLLYEGEKLRTKQCPVHLGKWSGCKLPEETECKGACMSGYNVTGWLTENKDA